MNDWENASAAVNIKPRVAAIDWLLCLHSFNLGEMGIKNLISPDGLTGGDGYLRLVGRIKDMIRVGGENVAAAEIESVLLKHHAVKQAVAVGMADPRLAEVVAGFVELKTGEQATEAELIDFCRHRLASFKVPAPSRNGARMADDRCRKDSALYFERVSAPRMMRPPVNPLVASVLLRKFFALVRFIPSKNCPSL